MTGFGPFADLDPSEAELDALDEAIREVDEDEIAYGPPDGEDGPWDDELAQLAGIRHSLDHDHAIAAQRAAEDLEDALARRPSSDARIARAFDRIEHGTYLPGPHNRPDRSADGQFAGRACGDGLDPVTGLCRSRYHAAGCLEVARAEASNGSHDAAEAWRATLRGVTAGQRAATLSPDPPDPGVPAERGLIHGHDAPPAVGSSLAQELGLY
jgi:hypothetical protein